MKILDWEIREEAIIAKQICHVEGSGTFLYLKILGIGDWAFQFTYQNSEAQKIYDSIVL